MKKLIIALVLGLAIAGSVNFLPHKSEVAGTTYTTTSDPGSGGIGGS